MFTGAAAYNQPLNAWDVGKVIDMNVRLDFGGAALNPHCTARAHAPH